MKVYLIKKEDLDLLLTMLDRNPSRGINGGSSQTLNQQEQQAHDDAHRFYNYQVRTWINKISEDN